MVRLLGEADAADLWALRREALERAPLAFGKSVEEHDQITVEAFAERLRPPEHFIAGAFQGDQLAGMAGFALEPGIKRRHRGVVWGVYVRDGARGKGLGRELFRLVIETARGIDGLETLLLSVGAHNDAAASLYRSVGFREYGLDAGALKVGAVLVDEVLMRYELTS